MKKNITVLSSCILFLSSSIAQKQFSLDEAIQYALKNSHTINIERTNIQDVEGQIKEYYAIGMPKVSASISYNYFIKLPTSIFPNFITPAVYDVLFDENLIPRKDIAIGEGVPVQFGTKNNLTAGIELSTLLFDGSFFVGLKAQRLYKDLIVKQINQSEAALKYQITKAYLAALSISENLTIIQKNILNLEKVKSEIAQIYAAGLIEKLDVDRVDLSLENLITERDKLEKIARISLNVLKFQMNFPLTEEIKISENLTEILNKSYFEIMNPVFKLNIQDRPEYPVIMQGLRLAEINIKRYKVAYLPSLYGFASYQQSLQRNKLFDSKDNKWFPTSLAGLNLNVPIFDGFDKKAKILKAKTLLNKTNLQFKQFENAANLEFENARTQYLNASVSIEARKKSVALAERIYNTANIKFKEGIGSSLEITSAERDVYQAQSNLLEAQIDLILAKVELDKSLGKL